MLAPELRRALWDHLLAESTMHEQAAFLFCQTSRANGGIIFEAVDHALLGESDFAAQHSDYLELSDEARIALIKHAHHLGAALAEFHSHPGPWPAAFSLADRIGLKETVPHMRWRLKKRPYLAIVVASSGFDALVFPGEAHAPEALTGIDAGGVVMRPTNNSLEGWDNDRESIRS